MRVSLGLLALGALTAWLLAGPLSRMLADTLPFHQLSITATTELIEEIFTEPITLLAMAVIGAGIAFWLLRSRLRLLSRLSQPLVGPAQKDLGFEWLNRQVIRLVQELSVVLCSTQTGQFNWNVAGIVGGLVVLLVILIWGTRW